MIKDKTAKEKLADLPVSTDTDFWGDADIHTNLVATPVKHTELSDRGHYFVRKAGKEAQCIHCGWGFHLDTGDRIVDGHLYNNKKELII